jgi:hypothetical protein
MDEMIQLLVVYAAAVHMFCSMMVVVIESRKRKCATHMFRFMMAVAIETRKKKVSWSCSYRED